MQKFKMKNFLTVIYAVKMKSSGLKYAVIVSEH